MTNFLENLTSKLSSVVNVGDTSGSLTFDQFENISQNIDRSATRNYSEEGFLRTDPYFTDVKSIEILLQEPSATLLVKKKMFSSLANNFRPDFMSKDEKLFYKATNALFYNKAQQISALEKLYKIERMIDQDDSLTDKFIPSILDLTDSLNPTSGSIGSSLFSNDSFKNLLKITDRLRKLYSFTKPSQFTKWINNPKQMFSGVYGEGTGVLEITNFTNVSTVSSNTSDGSCSFSISDPYKACFITEYDIEQAISDATNLFYNKKTFNFSLSQVEDSIATYKQKLNALRSRRGALPIDLTFNEFSSGKKVKAFISNGKEVVFNHDSSKSLGSIFSFNLSNETSDVDVTDDYLIGGSLGSQGLSKSSESLNLIESSNIAFTKTSELDLFKKLISSVYLKFTINNNSKNTFQLNNKLTNYARRKMHFYFLGKNIIQPMDEVRVFVNSKSKLDSNISSGLREAFAGQNFLQQFTSTIYDIKDQFTSIFNPTGNLDFRAEKSVHVGSDFPDSLWSMIRGYFVNDKEGPCIFAGVATSSKLGGTANSYSISVDCSDNSYYFDLGQVNFNPGVDNFNGYIFDPLTPFKSKFDDKTTNFKNEIPELLEENKIILSSAGKGLLKYKSGPGAGQLATEDNLIHDVSINSKTGEKKFSYHGPDGLVYNWKQGIGIFTQFGNSISLNDPSTVGNQKIFNNPFAGQDVMNVISLAITGIPYNFINYWKAVQSLEGYSRDPHNNSDASFSYFNSLRQDLERNNSIWGGFIPFKNLVIDELSYAKVLSSERRLLSTVNAIEDNINKLRELDNSLYLFGILDNTSQTQFTSANSYLLNGEFGKALNNDTEVLKSQLIQDDISNYGLKVIGSDVSFDIDSYLSNEDQDKSLSSQEQRRRLRRKVNYLTRRMPYAVRGNEDKNLLIVDDSYDKDYDLAAYESSIQNSLNVLYSNNFTTVKDNIKLAASLLNLEVYADSQGHIRVQPPQYNKIPSSVFNKLIQEKRRYGKQIYPDFIDNMFTTQFEAFKTKLEVLEDEIRLLSATIDLNDDSSIRIFINYGSGPTFSFLSDESGYLTNYEDLSKQSLPEVIENENFKELQNQTNSTRSFFTSANRYDALINLLTPENKEKFQNVSTLFTSERISRLNSRIQSKTGKKVNLEEYALQQDSTVVKVKTTARKSVDLFKVTKDIATKLSERQSTLKLFYGALKNSIEANSLFNDETEEKLLSPGLTKSIPESLEHLIEDESYDDYGPGSGKRYVIKNYQIKDINISENAPDYTSVSVSGAFNQFQELNNQGPSELNSLPSGGNGLVAAFAIDYDLWRMYGLKTPATVNVPFLSDPQSQCGPYASMLLSIARKQILSGSVSLVGNEYYQPGEVVYIEDLGLLFYVTRVSHSFTFGGSFTTSLELKYGHAPGDYIPSVLDMIGKVIYKNKDATNFINYRQQNSFNEQNVGVIILDPNSPSAVQVSDKDEYVSTYSQANAKVLNDIIYTTSYQLDINNIKDQNLKVTIELRTYYDSDNPTPIQLLNLKEDVYQTLTGIKKIYKDTMSNNPDFSLPKEFVITDSSSEINLDDTGGTRSPSSKATSIARDIAAQNSSYTGTSGFKNDDDKIREGVINYMIDCWIKFEYTGKQ